MTIFRALPVAQGDAFLLTTSQAHAYLVDGGRRRAGVPSIPWQLRASGVPYLDAAIVTHTDRDHVEGIEDLLREGFPVLEYWVPVNWLDTIHTARLFRGNWGAWIEDVRAALRGGALRGGETVAFEGELPRRRSADRDAQRDDVALLKDLVLGGIATSALALATTKLEESTSSESFNARRDELLARAAEVIHRGEQVNDAELYHDHDPFLDLGHSWRWPESRWSAAAGLSRVAMSAVEGIRSDAANLTRTLAIIGRNAGGLAYARRWRQPHRRPWIRFFDYRDTVVDHAVAGHPMICVNGAEVTEPIEMPRVAAYEMVALVARAVSLSRINRESRVFRFDDGASNVLFCGDSALGFVDKPLVLNHPAIVTAPHHGALANAKAYTRIVGRQLTWVRSDQQNGASRPCGNYVALARKYCTTCGAPPACVELVFDRTTNEWTTDSPPCRCTPRTPMFMTGSRSSRLPITR